MPLRGLTTCLVAHNRPHQPFSSGGHARFGGRHPRRCFIGRQRYFFLAFAFVPTRSFKAVAGRNATVVEALILIGSPVCGL